MKQTLADALAQRGYDTLTPVQEAVTNPELNQADLLVSAQTGSGKTVGFGLALAPTLLDGDRFEAPGAPLGLIIAPTRELAMQVKHELSWLYKGAGARMASCVGGMDMRDERRALERGAHIVVATPGRLRDHIQRGSIDLSAVRGVVLDEADEMLDLGFREDLEFILGEAPESRRTLLFSATVSKDIAYLAKRYQKDAQRVSTVTEAEQHADIEYRLMHVAPQDSENAIINVLRYYEAPNAIVFANTRAMVNRLTTRLSNRGFSVVSLSGELSQSERSHALQAMRDRRARICVATDVAARGIDLPGLDLVIHAELPNNHETLLHRSGRTGRAGRKGVSALIVPPKFKSKAIRLLRWAKLQADHCDAPSAQDIRTKDRERMLADPAWEADISEAEATDATELLDRFAPEQIAAAYLRLYHAQRSAPEELSAPDAKKPRKERPDFGPSTWFSIQGGRDAGADPRWYLPMICRAGNLEKADIGAIRIQQKETFVEIRQDAVPGFLTALDGKTEIEPGAAIAQLDGAPVLEPRGAPKPHRGKGPSGGGRPQKRFDRKPEYTPKDRPVEVKPARREAPRPDAERKPKPSAPKKAMPSKQGPSDQPKGPPPPKGKPNSKKNKARRALAAQSKGSSKGGEARPKRKSPKSGRG
ncbi:MAG: DEAD/DEAH box helicase [Rhodobacteraceae bacterium]|nr:DEAD/DEAH box helicase [Paracoccaceae bacterium]